MGRPRKPKNANLAKGTTMSKLRDQYDRANDHSAFQGQLDENRMTWTPLTVSVTRLTHIPSGKFIDVQLQPDTPISFRYYTIDRLLNMVS